MKAGFIGQLLQTRLAVIFIWGRSGSLLLQSLLDGHPEILNLPPNPGFSDFHFSQWDKLVEQSGGHFGQLLEAFVRVNPTMFDGRTDQSDLGFGHLGEDQQTPIQVDSQQFIAEMMTICSELSRQGQPLNRRNFFLAIHYAYARANGQDVSEKKLIVHQFHSTQNFSGMHQLQLDFPDVIGIGMLREPITSFNSVLRAHVQEMQARHLPSDPAHAGKPLYSWSHLVYDGWYSHMYRHMLTGWKQMQKYFNLTVHTVRLEDLHATPQATLESLMSSLQLGWDDSLLQSSFNGLKYWGDKSMLRPLSGLSAEHPQQSSGNIHLDEIDRYVLSGLLQSFPEMVAYRKLSLLERKLLPLALLVPSQLEREAFLQAVRSDDVRSFQNVILNLLERYLFSFKQLFGREIPLGISHHD